MLFHVVVFNVFKSNACIAQARNPIPSQWGNLGGTLSMVNGQSRHMLCVKAVYYTCASTVCCGPHQRMSVNPKPALPSTGVHDTRSVVALMAFNLPQRITTTCPEWSMPFCHHRINQESVANSFPGTDGPLGRQLSHKDTSLLDARNCETSCVSTFVSRVRVYLPFRNGRRLQSTDSNVGST